MDSPFIFHKHVTGKNFIGRKTDCNILSNLLDAGENILLFDIPKSGKRSVIQQTLINMRMSGKQFTIGEFTMFNVRNTSDMLIRLATAVIRAAATTPDEYKSIISEMLSSTNFIFDQSRFADFNEVISLTAEPDQNDVMAVTRLPYLLAKKTGTPVIIIINEFQNVLQIEDPDMVLSAMEHVVKEYHKEAQPKGSFIFCGSMVNAMKEIFYKRHYFHKMVERLPLRTIETKEFAEHIMRGYLSGGKVIDRELISGVCRLFRNHPGYINHFASICNYLSKGYITEPILLDALDIIISINEPKFKAIMYDLTTYQVQLLKAVLDGYSRFSAAEVIAKYHLNSSANVKRLKEALAKKEILTFDENDLPVILDPLFEYWVSKYYFGIKKDL